MSGAITPPSAEGEVVYGGRRWAAVLLFGLAAVCAAAAAATTRLDDAWLAIVLMGAPLAASACLCALYGWSEAFARVRLDAAGVRLALPRYRGFVAAFPGRRLTAAWPEIRQLRQRTVRGRLLGAQFDYIERRIVTDNGEAVLIEPLRSKYWGDAKGLRQALPAAEIFAEIARRTGLQPHDDGEIRGGGLIEVLFGGGPDQAPVGDPAAGPAAQARRAMAAGASQIRHTGQ